MAAIATAAATLSAAAPDGPGTAWTAWALLADPVVLLPVLRLRLLSLREALQLLRLLLLLLLSLAQRVRLLRLLRLLHATLHDVCDRLRFDGLLLSWLSPPSVRGGTAILVWNSLGSLSCSPWPSLHCCCFGAATKAATP
eukprot:CAMPEP_0115184784 /NCGR_PEP_ID=MMETSP0270-20121206/9138_1 /TAXON_ID=71861 /ORGANISM="Scrippsiella trochoidea, Strain CCMP3099" /LENGTH=139 /DNA_ID=CAMNT_0002597875 /DNA_START=1327 /DNA_END=1743 /DNA_ORIENTATION=-